MDYMNIKATLIKGLRRYKGHWPFIAQEAGVSYTFITHTVAGRTKDPRIGCVQKVLDVLKQIEDGKIKLPG